VGTEFPESIRVDESRLEFKGHDENALLSVLRSTRGLLVFVMMVLIFTLSAQPITDPDFWWHLKTGQYIVETRSIPHADIFSTLRFGSEWVTHEWLSEVFIYLVFHVMGFGGLIAFFSILITGSFWIVYQRCRKRGVHTYIAGFAVLLGAAATLPTWGVRPQMFSLLFASIYISFLDRYSRRESMSSIWWLAPLMVLWVNMHAGFALGLVLIVLTITGLLLDWLLLRKGSFADVWRLVRPLCWLLIVCVAAVSLNPHGPRMYSYPFETLTSQAMMRHIEEWKAPNFQEPMFQALALVILGTFSAFALSNKRVRPGELLMLTATAWATLRSGRNVAFFALVATPLLAEHSWNWISSQPWSQWLTVPASKIGTESKLKLGLNAVILLLIVTLGILAVRHSVAKQPISEAKNFPTGAVDFIVAHKPPQPIYNEYIWGGYLIWRLYPEYRVYIDGRADVYGDKLISEFLQIKDGKRVWREHLDNRGIRTVLIEPDSALASLLRQDSAWQNVFEDKYSVVFVRI
jgi:hypothetical protein